MASGSIPGDRSSDSESTSGEKGRGLAATSDVDSESDLGEKGDGLSSSLSSSISPSLLLWLPSLWSLT